MRKGSKRHVASNPYSSFHPDSTSRRMCLFTFPIRTTVCRLPGRGLFVRKITLPWNLRTCGADLEPKFGDGVPSCWQFTLEFWDLLCRFAAFLGMKGMRNSLRQISTKFQPVMLNTGPKGSPPQKHRIHMIHTPIRHT